MKTFSLALRNLLRNRRRSAMTLFAMGIGALTILVFGGYVRNILYSLQTGYVLRGGHIQIQRKDYFLYGTGNPAAYGIKDYPRVIDVVVHDPVLAPMTRVVTPSISLGGIAGNFDAGVSRTVSGVGLVVEDRIRMRAWNDYRLPLNLPPFALKGSAPDAAVVGIGVARVLELCQPLGIPDCARKAPLPEATGKRAPEDIAALAAAEGRPAAAAAEPHIELLAASAHGAPNVAALRVIKAERQGFKEIDDMFVGMHLAQAQRLLYGKDQPEATAVIIQLQHTSQIPAARARLNELLATTLKGEPLEVQDFEALNPFYGQAIGMFGAIFGFMAVLIGAIVLFTVGNTMSMAVVERTTEIGTLRAIGLRRSGIRNLFVCEGLLLGVIGTAAGVLAAIVVAWLINHSGLTWLPPGNVDRVPLSVRVWGETGLLLFTGLGLTAVAVLSAWWPARRAARLPVVDALRHV